MNVLNMVNLALVRALLPVESFVWLRLAVILVFGLLHRVIERWSQCLQFIG